MVAMKSQGAHTGVIIHTCVLAGASINAKIVDTLVGYSGFATVASPTKWARTGVRALTGVETGGAIFAWVVICAIIQILVAKKATPAGIYRWRIILAHTDFFQQSELVSAADF